VPLRRVDYLQQQSFRAAAPPELLSKQGFRAAAPPELLSKQRFRAAAPPGLLLCSCKEVTKKARDLFPQEELH
jgi:hypothetical protein